MDSQILALSLNIINFEHTSSNHNNQAPVSAQLGLNRLGKSELGDVFTLMIPEIANQMENISSILKTFDMSDFQYLSGFLDPLPMTIENRHEAILFAKTEIRRPSMM